MKKSILLLTSVATSLALTAAPVAQTSATLAKKASPKVSLSELTNKKLNTRATSARTAGMPALKSHPVQSRSSRIATPKSAAGLGQLSYRSMFRAPAKVADANCDLYGFMTYDATWSQEAPGYGLYDVNPNSPEYSLLWPNSENVGTTAFYAHGKIYSPYAITFWGMLLGQTWNVIDAATGLEVSEPTDLGTAYSYYAMTYVPKMGGALALVGDNSAQDIADAYKLARVDLDGSTTILADLDTDHLYSYGLTVGPDGDVYGLTNNGALYKINVSDFSATLVKDGVVDGGGYISALAYDKDANLIYYPSTPEAGNSFLFGINPTTGEAEARYDFGHQVEFGLLYLPAPAPAAGAPAAASALNADFAAGALSGNVTFKAPEVDSEGNALSGTLNYTVTVNGTELAPGTCAPGADVTVAASVPKGGYYDICVVCSNAAGAGAEANIVVFLGPDVPTPVANLALAYEDGSFKLTWDAAKGVHDGFVDQSKVVYTVTRYVNNVASVVSENQAATSFTEAYAEPASMESIFYTVKVSYDGNESVLAKSNSIVLGAINPPYFEDFASASAADFYTIIDSNNDEYTWAYSASDHAMEYTYSTEGPAEDYLVFPAMKLEAGKVYTIGFDAGCQSTSYPEKFIFYAGNDATEAALTDVLIPETEVNTPFMDDDANLTAKHFEANYVAKTTGLVYFAVKAVSDADMWSLYITNVSVSEGKSAKAPAVVSDLTAQADPTGAPTATISFTCPTTSIDGENLTSITSIEVIKGDEVVKTISNPAPGSAQSVVDSEAGQGNVTYTVIASNEQGEGLAAKVTVFVGFDVPAAVQNLSAANGADYGEVVLTWDPVTQDINGLTLPEESYNVYIYNASAEEWDLLAEGLSENTYSYRACAADAEQDFAQYAVSASNEQGAGQGASSGLVCIGKPYSMPYVESFDLHSILGTETISGYPSFGLADDATVSDLTSADQDNAYMYMQARYANTSGRVFTGKISVGADEPQPAFSFFYYCIAEDDENTIDVEVNDGSGWETLQTIVLGEGTPGEWCRVSANLNEYKGKDVQIGLTISAINYGNIFIDRLALESQKAKDFKAALSVAPSVVAGQNLNANVTVSNYGYAAQEGYTVELYVDGKIASSQTGRVLAAGASSNFTFEYPVAPGAHSELTVVAKVVLAGDEDLSNNETAPATVKVTYNNLPAVTDLAGEDTGNGIRLTWSEPDYHNFAPTVTEDFENLDSFATMNTGNTGGWTFVDLDKASVGGFQGIEIPNVPIQSEASWFVMDQSNASFNQSFAGHSGDKYLAALFNYDSSQNDDWAISPELSGNAQTVTFYARAYSSQYPETVEVLYSTTDKDPANFVSAKVISGITTDADYNWTLYSVDLPAGAKYMALRFISADTFMIMVDDVTYEPAGATSDLELLGYNIYRNGVKINNALVTETNYDVEIKVDDAYYTVTAVYANGESRPSNEVSPYTGVENLLSGMSVKGMKGQIAISGADAPVAVIDMAGRVIYRGSNEVIPAPAGAYIVTVGKKTFKVLVK